MAPSRLLIFFPYPFLVHSFSLAEVLPDLTYHNCFDYYSNNIVNDSAGSTYQNNLNLLLSSLPSKASANNGFYGASIGEAPDRANAFAFCRGDVTADACRACVNNTAFKLLQLCPLRLDAFGGYDECVLRYYGDYSAFEGRDAWADDRYRSLVCSSSWTSPSADSFVVQVNTIDRLRRQAALGDTVRKYFAADVVSLLSSKKLYVLVQCAPDLTNALCSSCLGTAASEIWDSCYRREGGRAVKYGCNIRYESYLFYNVTAAAAAMKASINTPAGISHGIIAGISAAVVAGALLLVLLCIQFSRRTKVKVSSLRVPENHYSRHRHRSSRRRTGFSVNKSLEYSYEELSRATNEFSIENKIGQGGFGAVYYADLRGERTAIKKMDTKASKEFLAELKVLTNVHHFNLVRLIGYSTDGSLFLVYEFIENGNLSEHLRGKEALPWSTRMQIALDSARGLLYIHEQTVPAYIHRDVKSANILLDTNFRAKVADFGLTKLYKNGGGSLNTGLVGTFGYMAPEYAGCGNVSVKVDVYAFGVVLYELISGKEAIVKTDELISGMEAVVGNDESASCVVGLVGLFDKAFSKPEPKENICKLVDPRIGSNYPVDLVLKVAQLGKACTHDNPQLRPSMRCVVVTLMTLLCLTEDWAALRGNQDLLDLMSAR